MNSFITNNILWLGEPYCHSPRHLVHSLPRTTLFLRTPQNNPKVWSSTVHTFFYEYSDGHPSWEEFDISPCLNRINRLFLTLTLEVAYSELVHYNLEVAKNSIRSAIAGIAGVSPLRITDLFVSCHSC